MQSSYISTFVAVSFICFTLIQSRNFWRHYKRRQRAWVRAEIYIHSETCTNQRVKSDLGSFNLCEESEEIMNSPPFFTAVVDTAEDIHICGNGYCEVLGMNITQALPQIVLVLIISALLILWAGGVQFRRNREKAGDNYWSLPGDHKKTL